MLTFTGDAQAALDALVTPVWLIDAQRTQPAWANRAALALFEAATLAELSAREPMRGASAFLLSELARLSDGAHIEGELRVARARGELVVACTFTGVGGEAGRLTLVEVHADRTAKVAPRAPDVEQRLQSRDRMASIGTLTAGVVHGINNPLAYVIANLEYVKRLLSKGPERLEPKALAELGDVLDDSLDGADRVRRIVSDLGNFSEPFDARVVGFFWPRAPERALGVAANEIRHRARVVREFSDVPAAMGSEAKLAQVVLNVLINAAHSIEPGAIERNAITLRIRADARGRPTLEIEDTGCGIAPEHLGRVFDPFFTTKPVGVGTGLGLSIAHRIVHELSGEIQIASVHGHGTRVTVTLPAAALAASVVTAQVSIPPLSSDRFRARVLVIDDEPAILRAFRRVLFSHDVSVAASGLEAMHKLGEGLPFDVIFCDVMMPEMSGVEVYQRISEQYPGQEHRLVFMTGGVFAEHAAQFLGTSSNPKLKKPFTGSSLRALVASMVRLNVS
jgi:two-component system cell cycle sensor histidine kinase/response regulator CckA